MDNKENINLQEINTILSKTLREVSSRKISPKRAQVISRIASALSRNIKNTELEERLEFLEYTLKIKKD